MLQSSLEVLFHLSTWGCLFVQKRITKAQYGILVDKMIAKIKVWSSRNLSYTARAQLINSVPLSTHVLIPDLYFT